MKHKKLILKIMIPVCLFVLFVVYAAIVNTGLTKVFDNNFMDFIYNQRGNKGNALYWSLRILTEFGYFYVVIAIVILIGILFKFDYRFFTIGITVLSNAVFNTIIKLIVSRTRPDSQLWWMDESSSSFPSGHSTTSFCFYVLILIVVLKTVSNKKIRLMVEILCSLIVLIVATSRLAMGVHYPTDVFGGFIVASISISIALIPFDYFKIRKDAKKNIA